MIGILRLAISTDVQGYVLGLTSYDNRVWSVIDIEQELDVDIPIISLFLDPYKLWETIHHHRGITWYRDKIFHITLSPNMLTAQQVAQWWFDTEYTEFFQFIKDHDIKVIFRTMHEMNGDRYPRSWNGFWYKKARRRAWDLSRKVGLDQSTILFDFSLNHRDMVRHESRSMRCFYPDRRSYCKTWEWYYPGDKYVDLMGITFYNRWKATSDRQRLSPREILIDDNAKIFERIKSKNKPIIIDEVATTKIHYLSQSFSPERSRSLYLQGSDVMKNHRLRDLAHLIAQYPEIIAMIYFNKDYTQWLQYSMANEADRAIVDPVTDKRFDGIYDLVEQSNDVSMMRDLFQPLQ